MGSFSQLPVLFLMGLAAFIACATLPSVQAVAFQDVNGTVPATGLFGSFAGYLYNRANSNYTGCLFFTSDGKSFDSYGTASNVAKDSPACKGQATYDFYNVDKLAGYKCVSDTEGVFLEQPAYGVPAGAGSPREPAYFCNRYKIVDASQVLITSAFKVGAAPECPDSTVTTLSHLQSHPAFVTTFGTLLPLFDAKFPTCGPVPA